MGFTTIFSKTDPSEEWNQEEKQNHINDIWYPLPLRWTGEKWEPTNSPDYISLSEFVAAGQQ